MDEQKNQTAARAAIDPNGAPVIAAYVCDACNHVHLAAIRGGAPLTTVGMTADQGDAVVFELQAAAGAAFAGHPFLSAPRVDDGSLVASVAAGPDTKVIVALGHTARTAFTATLSPDLTKGLAGNVADAVLIARNRIAQQRARIDAHNAANGHPDMTATVQSMVQQVKAAGGGDDGLISVGCSCGGVHLFPIRSGDVGDYLTMSPDAVDGFAADLVRSASEARELARAGAVPAGGPIDPPGTKH